MKWPRTQRFTLSPRGLDAEAQYREQIVASRVNSGRASFDAARAEWAKNHAIQADDGLYLAEVAAGPVNLQQIVGALETCGKNRLDAIAAIERLISAGLVSTA
jgi:hypothetical protein